MTAMPAKPVGRKPRKKVKMKSLKHLYAAIKDMKFFDKVTRNLPKSSDPRVSK